MSLQHLFTRIVAAASMVMALPLLAQEAKEKKPTAAQQAMMEAWQKAATPGSNHKLLAGLTGQWTFATKMWMEPGAPPEMSTGSAVYTPLMDGRFIQGEYTGTFGGMAFQGLGLTGYDNVARHFTATWADNMGTAIMLMTGTYDPTSKTFTYKGDMDDMMKPGTKVKVRQTVKILSDDSHVMEWYESRGGKEIKTMEITYTRQK
ncbi:DUF1579 domain-containing protein [Geothrix edaphica]|uniref:DUF1579 domain-containing protein n=1 Tax=Geothrix edaphica TaxID=2927976 RepID=A0ABQ5PUK4_9BACT|nr:DUF1579 domain-containing protein [Geothrix edaphica]GLH65839.1 hypothetical protein GETHED_02030 [Geothrix edaphica]